MSSRNWVFTKFNLSMTAICKSKQIQYMKWSLEECPTTKKMHNQGFVEFKNSLTMAEVKNLFDDKTMHLETRRGSLEANNKYCSKEETHIEGPWEIGTPKEQGKRNDLKELCKIIRCGLKPDDEDIIRFSKGIKELKSIVNKEGAKKFRKLTVSILYGETGKGKTRYVYDKHGYDNVYCLDQTNGTVWFDGYDGEDVLLIDDFYGWIPWGQLLRLLDGYPCRLQIKCGHTYANWTKVYITSNKKYNSWYPDQIDKSALIRRLSNVDELVPMEITPIVPPEVAGNTAGNLRGKSREEYHEGLDYGIENNWD